LRRLVTLVCLAGVVALPACSAPSPHHAGPGPASSGTAPSAPVPAGLERYYGQQLDFSDCGDGFECATLTVPLDYSEPLAGDIELALIKEPAGRGATAKLVVNPGGPGGSGVQFLRDGGGLGISAGVRQHTELIGFDPRGVGGSTAVKCLSDERTDIRRASALIPQDAAQLDGVLEDAKTFAAACKKNSPAGLLAHVDTASAARDLDVLRSALGERRLDYLGYSYGTKLGATYAELFPSGVGRMVLDGALDPSLDSTEVATGQAEAFERALDLYLEGCLASNACPFTGDVGRAREQLTSWVRQLETRPLPVDGRVLTALDAVQAILLPLYTPSNGDTLSEALKQAIDDGDAGRLMALADLASDRDDSGHYSNTNEAFVAINCVDYTHGAAGTAAVAGRAKALQARAPFFGRYMGYDDACSEWPQKTVDAPHRLTVDPSVAPVLVVGTTGDPATPYPWAESLAGQLPGSRLLTWKGEGHTAYGRSNSCVSDAVDAYLSDGTLPAEGTSC